LKPLHLLRQGQWVTVPDVPPSRTLLQVLREDLKLTGTKEGCAGGDCGACTVVVGQARGDELELKAINSCIRPAHAVSGQAVWTVEDLKTADSYHPAQEAMVRCHGSQCGFCTPGFVMSLVALHENTSGQSITREQAQENLSGNLCRCTGYRPILDAAVMMNSLPDSGSGPFIDKPKTLSLLEQKPKLNESTSSAASAYHLPTTLHELLTLRAAHPHAQLIAGATDVGLWITKQNQRFDAVIDLTRVAELLRVEDYPHHVAIGAAVSLQQAFNVLAGQRPVLHNFFSRFAGLQVRNAGTLGGNIANGSPIGDSMPLLIALGAHVVLMRMHQGQVQHREVPLEALYTGYKQNILRADEVLAWVKVPKPVSGEMLCAYKISKRFEDDISAVCVAIQLQLQDGVVVQASVGAGGVATTPIRAVQTQAALQGQTWSAALAQQAGQVMQAEFEPLSDLRASADYRRTLLKALWQRCWLESQGMPHLDLSDVHTLQALSELGRPGVAQ
jgi:xanthine dehydrogenase small subunit